MKLDLEPPKALRWERIESNASEAKDCLAFALTEVCKLIREYEDLPFCAIHEPLRKEAQGKTYDCDHTRGNPIQARYHIEEAIGYLAALGYVAREHHPQQCQLGIDEEKAY